MYRSVRLVRLSGLLEHSVSGSTPLTLPLWQFEWSITVCISLLDYYRLLDCPTAHGRPARVVSVTVCVELLRVRWHATITGAFLVANICFECDEKLQEFLQSWCQRVADSGLIAAKAHSERRACECPSYCVAARRSYDRLIK